MIQLSAASLCLYFFLATRNKPVSTKIFRITFGLISSAFLAVALAACHGHSSVASDSNSQTPATAQPAQQPNQTGVQAGAQPAQAVQVAEPTPGALPKAGASQTPLPIIKEAMAKPGVPVAVPESMKRPMTKEELEKALQAMPPEVRARIQGLATAPHGVAPKPSATPKQ